MPKRKRRDANHSEIAGYLNTLGFEVQDTSQVGNSFPDLVASLVGINVLLEIKTEQGGLEPGQVKFIDRWKGPVFVIKTQADCIDLRNHLMRQADEKRKAELAYRGQTEKPAG